MLVYLYLYNYLRIIIIFLGAHFLVYKEFHFFLNNVNISYLFLIAFTFFLCKNYFRVFVFVFFFQEFCGVFYFLQMEIQENLLLLFFGGARPEFSSFLFYMDLVGKQISISPICWSKTFYWLIIILFLVNFHQSFQSK